MFVMTIDQQRSRKSADAVPALLDVLNSSYADHLVLGFERTAGDEVQGLVAESSVVVDITVKLLRAGIWSIGIGVGPVEKPLPKSVRAARGAAFIHARTVVERAKNAPHGVALDGFKPDAAHAESALWLLASVVGRRTEAGWEAVEAVQSTTTQAEAAKKLRISPQAVNSRLHVAGWKEERRGRELVAHLIEGAS